MGERDISYDLVSEIEQHPCLYNFNMTEYSNKALIEKTWCEIAEKISITVGEAKEKWRNIRSSYSRSMKAPRSGSSRPKKPYYLSAYLEFILPYIKSKNTLDPGTLTLCEEDLEQELKRENQDQHSRDEEDYWNDHDIVEGSTSPPLFNISDRRNKKRLRPEEDRTSIVYLKNNERSKDCQDLPSSSTTSTHPMQYFFLSLLGEFDTMTESQMRTFKIRVLQLIGEIKGNQDAMSPPTPNFPFLSSPQS